MSKAKKSKCLYCGNNPTNHFISFFMQTLFIGLAPILKISTIFENRFTRALSRMLMIPYMYIFEKIHIISWGVNPDKASTTRSLVIWQEAEKRGIKMEQLYILKKPIEQYRAKMNNKWFYFESLPIPPKLAKNSSYAWLDDKWTLKKFLERKGLPVPRGFRITGSLDAGLAFTRLDKPLIVKPELGSRGRHTITQIFTLEDLKKSCKIAKKLCYFVICEEMLMGSVYRATYVGGEVVGILRGDQPKITGDGEKTIDQLVEEKNKNKKGAVKDFVFTKKEEDFIGRQGYNRDSILEKDKNIQLSEKIGLAYGGDAVEIIDKTHPKVLDTLRRAGDALCAPVIGFDFIIPDPTSDPSAQKWGIIEANSLPFIDLHHFPNEGTPINVAGKIWDLWR